MLGNESSMLILMLRTEVPRNLFPGTKVLGYEIWFATRVNPKTRVTQSFFKPENPGLESL